MLYTKLAQIFATTKVYALMYQNVRTIWPYKNNDRMRLFTYYKIKLVVLSLLLCLSYDKKCSAYSEMIKLIEQGYLNLEFVYVVLINSNIYRRTITICYIGHTYSSPSFIYSIISFRLLMPEHLFKSLHTCIVLLFANN